MAGPLDRFVLGLTGRDSPRVCFVGTASGDSRDYIGRFHRAFDNVECTTTHLELFRRDATDGLSFDADDFAALGQEDIV